jgi:hypothetical protein
MGFNSFYVVSGHFRRSSGRHLFVRQCRNRQKNMAPIEFIENNGKNVYNLQNFVYVPNRTYVPSVLRCYVVSQNVEKAQM